MQKFQESLHAENHDYREGSPHLKHLKLYDSLVARLRQVLHEMEKQGGPVTVLDVGAGEGSFVEPVLSSGFYVTALEMSRPSIKTLEDRFGTNPNFEVYFDQDGTLDPLRDRRFCIVLYTAVLHHIPDYLAAIDNVISNHLTVGGGFVSFQDPLWYPSVNKINRLFAQISYFAWRLGQGNYARGLRTRLRRLRGIYDDSNSVDMAEYHVIRKGVNQDEIQASLSRHFDSVSLISYWSTQSPLWQKIGESLKLKNTFGIIATGYRG